MAAYVPEGWPDAVRPPGGGDFEESAVAFPVKFICSTRFGVGQVTCVAPSPFGPAAACGGAPGSRPGAAALHGTIPLGRPARPVRPRAMAAVEPGPA